MSDTLPLYDQKRDHESKIHSVSEEMPEVELLYDIAELYKVLCFK